MSFVRRFLENEVGATSVEYGIAGAIIGLGIVVSLKDMKSALTGLFEKSGTNMKPKVVN